MPGTFSGIEIASRALATSQSVIDVIGHNVANVNTPGYTRQRAEIAATPPTEGTDGGTVSVLSSIGMGVQMTGVDRIRDAYLEQQLQSAGADQGAMNQLRDTLARVQSAYSEPGSSGLSSMLSSFFNSFQELSQNPENLADRQGVLSAADNLSRRFNTLMADLDGVSQSVSQQVSSTIQQANDLAQQIAGLNAKIHSLKASGEQPNDLQDQRDQLAQQMTNLVGGDVSDEVDGNGNPTGGVNVSVGGYPLVQGQVVNELPSDTTMVGGVPALVSGSEQYLMRSGAASGLLRAASIIDGYQSTLNGLASSLITAVNQIHQNGYGLDGSTGHALFSGTDARTIKLDATMAGNPNALAAATPPAAGTTVAAGNGNNALAIAKLANASVISGSTIGDAYASHVAQVGQDAHSYDQQATNQAQVIQQLQASRGSVSGVNMDEEMTQMIQYQRSYQAAARMLSVMDDMLNTLITSVGG